ncbi:hypothetical protein QBC41DRAFT_349930 [Cercophora samala]|uniref:Prolyl 4-hydroxylase alpha subunit Fe(2+) 2OG dioxygenase domain-containing protein n=1 Tax=Cercophora samala TaxID=330535 RepID=A0AA39Z6E8_9PEZI|nr:hypothetical protein QBC41DRAFT_349930 [Cercophora samala]
MANKHHHALKKDILKAYEQIQFAGLPVSFSCLDETELAGLYIKGLGEIAIPLSERQACDIIARCRHASCASGNETNVEAPAQRIWELEASQLFLRNPEWWSSHIRFYAELAAKQMGIEMPIKTEICKMVLHEEGVLSRVEQDYIERTGMAVRQGTEPSPGTFGTLVITLPSAHTGGDFVFTFNDGETITCDPSQDAQSFLSWYSDVPHQVLPVTSGYRWALTCNLILDPSVPQPTASGLRHSDTTDLRVALERWLESDNAPHFYMMLDHQDYTLENMTLHGLKGKDHVRLQALDAMSEDLEVVVCLALVSSSKSIQSRPVRKRNVERFPYDFLFSYDYMDASDSEPEQEVDNEGQEHFKLRALYNLDGRLLVRGLQLHDNEFLADKPFDGFPTKMLYNRSTWEDSIESQGAAIVVFPRNRFMAYLLRPDLGWWDGYGRENLLLLQSCFVSPCLQPDPDASSIMDFKEFWAELYLGFHTRGRDRSAIFHGESLFQAICKVAVLCGEFGIFEEVASESSVFGRDLFDPEMVQWLRDWLGVDEKEAVRRLCLLQKGLLGVFQTSSLGAQLGAVATLVPVMPRTAVAPLPLLHVGQSLVLEVLSNTDPKQSQMFDHLAGRSLADACFYFRTPLDGLKQHIAPYITQLLDKPLPSGSHEGFTPFLSTFASRLKEHAENKLLPPTATKALSNSLMKLFLTSGKFSKYLYHLNHDGRTCTLPKHIPEQLFNLFHDLNLSSPENGALFLQAVSHHVHSPEFHTYNAGALWIPFLHLLLDFAANECRANGPQEAVCRAIYTKVFTIYDKKHVGPAPVRDPRKRFVMKCQCQFCVTINGFLPDATREVLEFRGMKPKHRRHLHREMGYRASRSELGRVNVGKDGMVITKRFGDFEDELARWKVRAQEGMDKWGAFDQGKLRDVLGGQFVFLGVRLGGGVGGESDQGQERNESVEGMGAVEDVRMEDVRIKVEPMESEHVEDERVEDEHMKDEYMEDERVEDQRVEGGDASPQHLIGVFKAFWEEFESSPAGGVFEMIRAFKNALDFGEDEGGVGMKRKCDDGGGEIVGKRVKR